jgi:ABC-type amino acid transport substrate-binding protein
MWKLLILTLCLPWLIQCAPAPTAAPTPTAVMITPTTVMPQFKAGDGSDVLDQVLSEGVLRVGVRVWPEAAFAPPVFRGASNSATGGAMTGFEVDIAKLLAHDLGVQLELVEANPPALLAGDWQNQWDIGLGLLTPFDATPALTMTRPISYSQPYGYMPLALLVAANETKIHGLADLAEAQVGVVAFSGYQQAMTVDRLTIQGQPFALKLPLTAQLVPTIDLLDAMTQLSQSVEITQTGSSLQALFGPAPMWQQAINTGWAVKLTPVVAYQPIAVAAVAPEGKHDERLLQALNQILARLDEQHQLTEIYVHWYDEDFSRLP